MSLSGAHIEKKDKGDVNVIPSWSSHSKKIWYPLTKEWLPLSHLEIIALFLVVTLFILNYARIQLYKGKDVGAARTPPKKAWSRDTCYNYKWRAAARWMYETAQCYGRWIKNQCQEKGYDITSPQGKAYINKLISHTLPQRNGWTKDDELWLVPALRRLLRVNVKHQSSH